MKAIITGATGFLGRHLIEYLDGKGWQIIAVGRNEAVAKQWQQSHIRFKKVDLCNSKEVMAEFESADVVFHCAALSSVWGDYQSFYDANVIATQHVIQACHLHGVKRLVYVSTPSIYFDYHDRLNIKETDALPKKFVNAYAKTKYLAEQLISKANTHIETVIIRPRGLFGEYDTSIMPRILKLARKGLLPKFKSNGNLVDLTYVVNVAHSLYLAAITPKAAGQIYNITNAESVVLEDNIQHILSELNIQTKWVRLPIGLLLNLATVLELCYRLFSKKEPPITRYSLGVLAFSQTLCIDKARAELRYAPIYSINQGIEYYVRWHEQQN